MLFCHFFLTPNIILFLFYATQNFHLGKLFLHKEFPECFKQNGVKTEISVLLLPNFLKLSKALAERTFSKQTRINSIYFLWKCNSQITVFRCNIDGISSVQTLKRHFESYINCFSAIIHFWIGGKNIQMVSTRAFPHNFQIPCSLSDFPSRDWGRV